MAEVLRRASGRALNPRDIGLIAAAVSPAVGKARELHGELAGRYYREAALATFGGDGASLPAVRDYTADALTEGILAVTRDRTVGRQPFDRVVTGTAVRHARAAGIDRIRDAVQYDQQATGWARVHLGSKAPCGFCAMLISRGPVYKSEETAGFAAHNGCECHPEPLFRGQGGAFPGHEQYDRYQALWDEVNARHSGRDALNAFRRAMSA